MSYLEQCTRRSESMTNDKVSYASELSDLIDGVFDDRPYQTMIDWLLGRYEGVVELNPMPSSKVLSEMQSAAKYGLDSYKLYVRGTSDDMMYLRQVLDKFYESLVSDFHDIQSDDFSYITWDFNSIDLNTAVHIAKSEGSDGLRKALEKEIYDRFVSKKI